MFSFGIDSAFVELGTSGRALGRLPLCQPGYTICGGTSDVQLNNIAERLLGPVLRPVGQCLERERVRGIVGPLC